MHNNRLPDLLPVLLNDDDLDAQGDAIAEFYTLKDERAFSVDDLIWLVHESTAQPPSDEVIDPSSAVLVYALDIADLYGIDANAVVAELERSLPKLRDRAMQSVLELLCVIPTADSVRLYTRILEERSSSIDRGDIPLYDLVSLSSDAKHDPSVFQSLLQEESMRLKCHVHGMICNAVSDTGSVPSFLIGYEERFAVELDDLLKQMLGLQESYFSQPNSKRRDLQYLELQDAMWNAVCLAAAWDYERHSSFIEYEMKKLRDPRLRLLRADLMLSEGREVEDEELAWIASQPLARNELRESLLEHGLKKRLPDQCRDLESLAEAQMISWLEFPTELGVEPDEIELLHTEVREEKMGRSAVRPTYYFFYRFRTIDDETSKLGPWMVGMAGGFQEKRGGVIDYGADTYSHYNELDKLSLEKHVNTFFMNEKEG